MNTNEHREMETLFLTCERCGQQGSVVLAADAAVPDGLFAHPYFVCPACRGTDAALVLKHRADAQAPYELEARACLVRKAAEKPVRRVVQFDHFGDHKLYVRVTHELRGVDCIRLQLPAGTPKADALEALDAIREWIQQEPADLDQPQPPTPNWIGRRNLQPQQASVLRGHIYNRRKKAQHRPEKRDQNDPVNPQRTAEIVAEETGVSATTIKRDGKLAAEVDADPELQAAMNNRTEFKKVRKRKRKRSSQRKERRALAAMSKTRLWSVTGVQDAAGRKTRVHASR